MNHNKQTIKSVILAAAVSLGFAVQASAQDASLEKSQGVIGSRYASVELNYFDLQSGPPTVGRGITVAYNQPVTANIDVGASYESIRIKYSGTVNKSDKFDALLTGYIAQSWGKPFVAAGLGWMFGDVAAFTEDSLTIKASVGSEFAVAKNLTVTPYVGFARIVSNFQENDFIGGVKAAYRLDKDWDLTARVEYIGVERSSDVTKISVGANYRF